MHSAHEAKLCSECGNKKNDVFDRASFSGKKLLCRECVELVEERIQQEYLNEILEGYDNGT